MPHLRCSWPLLVVAACGTRSESPSTASLAARAEMAAAPVASAPPPPAGASAPAPAPLRAEQGRKLIRTATMEVLVVDYDATKPKLVAAVAESGGFTSNAEVRNEDSYRVIHMVVRVPSERFDALIDRVRPLGRVKHETLATLDVSANYFDADARLRNLRVAEDRLLALVRESRGRLEDLLAVEKELTRVRGDIEALTATLRHLDDQVALSTVDLTVREELAEVVDAPDDVWQPLRELWRNAGAMARRSFGATVAALAFVASALIYLVPWLLLVGVPVAWWWRRRRARKRAAAAGPPAGPA